MRVTRVRSAWVSRASSCQRFSHALEASANFTPGWGAGDGKAMTAEEGRVAFMTSASIALDGAGFAEAFRRLFRPTRPQMESERAPSTGARFRLGRGAGRLA